MLSRIKNSLIFQMEQVMIRGAGARFGVLLMLIVLVSLIAGAVVRLLAPGFDSTADAIWWAFLRLTDPGYLGDDEGIAKATVSTAVTVLGYILFMGALIAILVQWLSETMDHLERGLTPVVLDAHFVIAGWTSRTPTILAELLVSQGRVDRFLRRRGARRLHLALLAENADAGLMRDLKHQLGEHWHHRQIVLRSGSALRLEDLKRVDFAHAGVILLPAADTSGNRAVEADTQTVKTVMTMAAAFKEEPPAELPLIVAELQDPRHARTLRKLYTGPMEIVSGDETIARLIVQTVRHPGLSYVFAEFTSDISGSQIYVREEPSLVGMSFRQLIFAFPRGLLLGLVRPQEEGFRAMLNPRDDLKIQAGDRIAVLASSYQDAAPPATLGKMPEPRSRSASKSAVPAKRRVLVLGWNHRVPALLNEFASYREEAFEIDIVSQVPTAAREKRLSIEALDPGRLKIRQVELDYTVHAYLEEVDPTGYDNIVMLASERLKSGAESDARTILGYLLVRELLETLEEAPPVLVEIMDPANVTLFDNRRGETIVSPNIASLIMARVALRQELQAVYDELFTTGGCEVEFRRVADYGLPEVLGKGSSDSSPGSSYTFGDLQRAADLQGEIAIGIRRAGQQRTASGGVELNPGRVAPLALGDSDELIVLSTQ